MPETSDTARHPVIFIVEDRPVMRAMVREFVQNAFPDCTVIDAPDGTSAMELCAEHKPRLVLMDVRLPDVNGIELTARIKAETPSTSVIVLSSSSGPVYFEQARLAGADAYIVKDRLFADLIPVMADILGPGGARGANR